jgi:hypothetical protein
VETPARCPGLSSSPWAAEGGLATPPSAVPVGTRTVDRLVLTVVCSTASATTAGVSSPDRVIRGSQSTPPRGTAHALSYPTDGNLAERQPVHGLMFLDGSKPPWTRPHRRNECDRHSGAGLECANSGESRGNNPNGTDCGEPSNPCRKTITSGYNAVWVMFCPRDDLCSAG